MNTSKLESLIDGKKFTKAKVVKATGISRPALDSILAGNDFKVSNLEKLAHALNIKIGFLFDEDEHMKEIQTEGNNSPASDSGDVSVVIGDAVLAERVKSLESLVAEKNERISELKERIQELKSKSIYDR